MRRLTVLQILNRTIPGMRRNSAEMIDNITDQYESLHGNNNRSIEENARDGFLTMLYLLRENFQPSAYERSIDIETFEDIVAFAIKEIERKRSGGCDGRN